MFRLIAILLPFCLSNLVFYTCRQSLGEPSSRVKLFWLWFMLIFVETGDIILCFLGFQHISGDLSYHPHFLPHSKMMFCRLFLCFVDLFLQFSSLVCQYPMQDLDVLFLVSATCLLRHIKFPAAPSHIAQACSLLTCRGLRWWFIFWLSFMTVVLVSCWVVCVLLGL